MSTAEVIARARRESAAEARARETERVEQGDLVAEAHELTSRLGRFTQSAWPVLEPGTTFRPNWHIDAISEHLEAVSDGELRRLIINISPRCMKSLNVSVMWPCWAWTKRPELRWLFTSYAMKLATHHSVDRRTLLQSHWYRRRFGDAFRLSTDQNVKTAFSNDHRGHMIATSVGGSVTGEGGDIVVIDDPMDPDDAWSDAKRETANRFFDQTLTTRLDDPNTGAFVVVMQRLHEEDLTGHLLAKETGWEILCLPMEYEPSHPFVWPDDPRTEPGELMWPGRFNEAAIASAKIDLGSYGYAGQHQQRPAAAEGGIFKRRWWRFYNPEAPLPVFTRLVQSWDTTWKDKLESDFVVGALWGEFGADRYLLRVVRGRWDVAEGKRQILAMNVYAEELTGGTANAVLVENTANGPEIVAQLRRDVSGVIAVNVKGDKVQRAHAAAPQIEAGNIFLPGRAAADGSGPDNTLTPGWVQQFIDEHASFPFGAHDDQVDTTSQALIWMRSSGVAVSSADADEPRARETTAGLLDRDF